MAMCMHVKIMVRKVVLKLYTTRTKPHLSAFGNSDAQTMYKMFSLCFA